MLKKLLVGATICSMYGFSMNQEGLDDTEEVNILNIVDEKLNDEDIPPKKNGHKKETKGRCKLPTGARDILMTWLRINKQHPYPSDREKAKLIEITGMDKTQINNWFSNARRRVLKKILEEESANVVQTNKPCKKQKINNLPEPINPMNLNFVLNEENEHPNNDGLMILLYAIEKRSQERN